MGMSRCGSLCSIGSTHFVKLYEIYMFFYATSVFAFFGILLQISFITIILLKISNINIEVKYLPMNFVLIILFTISTIFYVPILFTKTTTSTPITKDNRTTLSYSVVNTQFGNSGVGKTIIIFISVIRGIGFLVLISVLNFITFIKFEKQLLIKKKICLKAIGKCFFLFISSSFILD